jgi:peroxiredoxin
MNVGQHAPEFSLYDTNKSKVSLAEFKGKPVVLVFFPQAFSSICTAELCGLRDNMKIYESLDAQVIGISVDSLFTLHQFKEHNQFTFPLLSDFNKEVSKAYNCFYEDFVFDMKGVSRRGVFVIDSQGVIRHRDVLESAGDLPDFNLVQSILAKINVPANN